MSNDDNKDGELYDLNLVHLLKACTRKDLQNIAHNMGEKNVTHYTVKKNKKAILMYQSSSYIANTILKNPNYILKTKEELDLEYEKQFKEKIKNKLYADCVTKENTNYQKPCLEYTENYRMMVNRKSFYKYILSYVLHNNIDLNNIPKTNELDEKLEICHGHHCSKKCIEPTHLSLKTNSENNFEDKIRDGTINRGSKCPNSKIIEDLALKIKHSKGEGTQKERAIKFGVSKSVIKGINGNESWFYLPDKNGIVHERSAKKKNKNQKEKKEIVILLKKFGKKQKLY